MTQLPSLIRIAELSNLISSLQPEVGKVFVLVDAHTRKHCLKEIRAMIPALAPEFELMAGQGERHKSMAKVIKLSHVLLRRHAERNDLIINLGGGVVSDLGGFLASIIKRGIRYINIPTSLIGMIDAAHGGKTAVNSGHLKNQIGTFHFPEAVAIHPGFLHTLPPRHLKSGYAEMFKHGLIADASHFEQLLKYGHDEIMHQEEIIYTSIHIKSRIVEADPNERGVRSLLNFGHSVGHALESWSFSHGRQALSHGHAVAIGMMVESEISAISGDLKQDTKKRIQQELSKRYELPQLGQRDIPSLLSLMTNDKKNESGVLKMPLLLDIGSAKPGFMVQGEILKEAMHKVLLP